MKTILFLRHGKSDWKTDHESDSERPLAKRGRKASRRMGRFLAQTGVLPDSVIVSEARRARQTLKRFAKAAKIDAPIRQSARLYLTNREAILEEIQHEPDTTEVLLLVGHEPTWSDTVSYLIGGGDVRMPTAALARIDVDVDSWTDVRPGSCTLSWLVTPAALTGKVAT